MIFEEKTRAIPISSKMVENAYKKVRANHGSAGIDKVSIPEFEKNLSGNLYKIWNRLSSGSYFPPAVKEHAIRKENGKVRRLGIPTVSDRVAQQVIKDYLEPRLEAVFHDNSYGYRPGRSAHEALRQVRENVREYAWVIDMDISDFFDTVSHVKLLSALDRHVDESWVKMYIVRWLEAPVVQSDGETVYRQGQGTPQGGVISPLLANLYLHYTFDKWFEIHFPTLNFVRYADDIVIHCKTERQSVYVLDKVRERFGACNLSLHSEKTKIVHCKDYRRSGERNTYPVKFDFLGFSFCPMSKKSKYGGIFLGFDCKISRKSYSKIVGELRNLKFDRWAKSWQEISELLDSKIRGWVRYYEKIQPRTLQSVFRILHNRLVKWLLNRYKSFKRSRRKAFNYLRYVRKHYPNLFYHWTIGYPIV